MPSKHGRRQVLQHLARRLDELQQNGQRFIATEIAYDASTIPELDKSIDIAVEIAHALGLKVGQMPQPGFLFKRSELN